MATVVKTAFHALDTSELQNSRFSGIIRPGVYLGYKVRPNVGQTNLLDITRGADGRSLLVTAEGVLIEETEDVVAAVALEPADAYLTRVDLIVAEYKFAADANITQKYKVIKGKNQSTASSTPTYPVPATVYQVPLAYVTVRALSSFGGGTKAQIATADVLPVPKASWAPTPDALSALKPVISETDSRRVFVYPGLFPNSEGTAIVRFQGGYTPPVDPDTFSDNQVKYFTVGVTDTLSVEFVAVADTVATLPELSNDTVPVAIVKALKVGGVVRFIELEDIRTVFARKLEARSEDEDYKNLLANSVFKKLLVVPFTSAAKVDLLSTAVDGVISEDVLAVIDTTDSSLKITWIGDGVPPAVVTINTRDLISGSGASKIRHFMVCADTTYPNVLFAYSTSSGVSGFSSNKFRLNELVRIPFTGATKLYLRFEFPPAAVKSTSTTSAKIFSLGLLHDLDATALNTYTIPELGIDSLRAGATQNLIANGNFQYWSKPDQTGTPIDPTTDQISFITVNEDLDETALADGWQVTEFGAGLDGQTVQRAPRLIESSSFIGSATGEVDMRFTVSPGASSKTVIEYRIPFATDLVGNRVTFALEYSLSAPGSMGMGVATMRRVSGALFVKDKSVTQLTESAGLGQVTLDAIIGADVDQLSFFVEVYSGTVPVTVTLRRARAAVGEFLTELPYTPARYAAASLRELYEHGRAFMTQTAKEGVLVGQSVQFGAKKAVSLGTQVFRALQTVDANKSTNIGDLSFSATQDSGVISAPAASDGPARIDVQWESYVKYTKVPL